MEHSIYDSNHRMTCDDCYGLYHDHMQDQELDMEVEQ